MDKENTIKLWLIWYIYYLDKSFIWQFYGHNFFMNETEHIFQNEKESIPQLFGRNVRKYRKARNLTQEQLSEKLEISQKHLSIIETGSQFASASLIGRISEVLNVSPGDLFGGSSDEILHEIISSREMILKAIRMYSSI